MKAFFATLLVFTTLLSCKTETTTNTQESLPLKTGDWHAVLDVQDGKQLPFTFKVNDNNTLTVFNAEEEVNVEDINVEGDTITIQFPVYEGIIKGTFDSTNISAKYIKPSLNRIVNFTAAYGKKDRFEIEDEPSVDMSGSWETIFSPGTEDSYVAKGIFIQDGNTLTGTFRTTTGDYRYLEGVVYGNYFELSTFDGAHAFLFSGQVEGDQLKGTFYSGNHFKEPFEAMRNDAYELPDANALTYIKDGYDGLEFTFPNLKGESISLNDDNLKGKVRIIQIMGTWCPNCLDETRYYVDYYNANKTDDLEFLALAFEYAPTKEKAFKSIERLKDNANVPYPILLAQYGSADKAKSQEKLPMLNQILSYPTTIFVDKKGVVRKIHTGFDGPATGEKYEVFKREFDAFVTELLAE